MDRRVWPVSMALEAVTRTRQWEPYQASLWLKDEICPGRCWVPCHQSLGLLLIGMLRVGSRLGWKWIGWVLWLYDSSLSSHYQSCLSFLLKSAVGLKEESRYQNSSSQWFKQLFSQTEAECPWHPPSHLLTSSVFSLPPIPNQIKAAGECVGWCWLKLWIGPNISFLPHYFLLFGIFSSNFDRQIIL